MFDTQALYALKWILGKIPRPTSGEMRQSIDEWLAKYLIDSLIWKPGESFHFHLIQVSGHWGCERRNWLSRRLCQRFGVWIRIRIQCRCQGSFQSLGGAQAPKHFDLQVNSKQTLLIIISNLTLLFRDQRFKSLYTGNMSAAPPKTFMEAYDDSLEAFIAWNFRLALYK